jgi:LemA protein
MKRRSSVTSVLLIVLIVIVALALVGGGCAISGYNKAIQLDEGVKTAWAQVETQLQRRYDLIPNVVETVKGYAKHESELFTHVADARKAYFQASQSGTRAEHMAAANTLGGVVSRLLMLQERYPELKAQEQFQTLIVELEGTENRIGVARTRYNDAVRGLNTYQRSMFGRMFCGWASVGPADYFEAPKEAREAPKVDFGSGE